MFPGPASTKITPPKLIRTKTPELSPEFVGGARGTATLIARCTLTTAGTLIDCCIVEGINGLNASTIAALRERLYEPAIRDGKPLTVRYTFRVRFEIQ